jgi:hypothetical protein
LRCSSRRIFFTSSFPFGLVATLPVSADVVPDSPFETWDAGPAGGGEAIRLEGFCPVEHLQDIRTTRYSRGLVTGYATMGKVCTVQHSTCRIGPGADHLVPRHQGKYMVKDDRRHLWNLALFHPYCCVFARFLSKKKKKKKG